MLTFSEAANIAYVCMCVHVFVVVLFFFTLKLTNKQCNVLSRNTEQLKVNSNTNKSGFTKLRLIFNCATELSLILTLDLLILNLFLRNSDLKLLD